VLDLLLRACRLPEATEPTDVSIEGGQIAAIGHDLGVARETLEARERLVDAGFGGSACPT
jgi:dihydroorotase-like cyclic amidohydrolase